MVHGVWEFYNMFWDLYAMLSDLYALLWEVKIAIKRVNDMVSYIMLCYI